jgi:hypothetical protein
LADRGILAGQILPSDADAYSLRSAAEEGPQVRHGHDQAVLGGGARKLIRKTEAEAAKAQPAPERRREKEEFAG